MTRIADVNRRALTIGFNIDVKFARWGRLDGAVGVLREIQEDLQQSVALGENSRRHRRQIPVHDAVDLAPVGFDHDAEVVKNGLERKILDVVFRVNAGQSPRDPGPWMRRDSIV